MSANDTSPLNIILVKNGSKGDRLLFRYPFAETKKETVVKNHRQNPYAMAELSFSQSRSPSNISNGHLIGFSDKVLSNLFAVKAQLCGKKFELKVNDVRFVGHPILLQSSSNSRSIDGKGDVSTILLFNIVFALRANASQSIVKCYHDLSCRLGIALMHEERRCSYLSREDETMLVAHDEIAVLPENQKESPYQLILQRSQLARELKLVYDDLCSTGFVHLQINKWLHVSFCLPQKVHQQHYREHTIDPETIKTCLESLRPYHALLLLVSEVELLNSLPVDASPAIVRLVQVINPLRSLQELAADADLSLLQVFQLAGHLVYWAKATVIYPLCETNVYVLSPHAPTHMDSPLVNEFSEKFSGDSLLSVMSEFSLPVSLSQRENLTNLPQQQKKLLQMIIWMLQRNLLMQLHTYVYLMPTSSGCGFLSNEKIHDSKSAASPEMMGNSYTASESGSENLSELQVVSEDCSPSSAITHGDDLDLAVDMLNQKRNIDNIFHDLTQAERESVLQVPAAGNHDDLMLFSRLYKYFQGQHHLEEIMYLENIRRTELLALVDKFRDVLVTCQHEDDAIAVFYTHSKT